MRRCVVILTLMLLGGCGERVTAPAITPAINMFLETSDGRLVRYDVRHDGQLRFAGGTNARSDIWSWTGSITPAQGAELEGIVRRGGWLESDPIGQGSTGNQWEVLVKEGGQSRRFRVHGDAPSVDAAWSVLTEAGKQRLDPELSRLRRPDIDKLVEQRRMEHEGNVSP